MSSPSRVAGLMSQYYDLEYTSPNPSPKVNNSTTMVEDKKIRENILRKQIQSTREALDDNLYMKYSIVKSADADVMANVKHWCVNVDTLSVQSLSGSLIPSFEATCENVDISNLSALSAQFTLCQQIQRLQRLPQTIQGLLDSQSIDKAVELISQVITADLPPLLSPVTDYCHCTAQDMVSLAIADIEAFDISKLGHCLSMI